VFEVRLLLLRREADGGERAADEVETGTEGVRHAHENVLGTRARTILRAARRRGRRIPTGLRPGNGVGDRHRRRVSFGRGGSGGRDGGRGGGRQRQFRAAAVGRVRVHVRVHRLRRGRTTPAGRWRRPHVLGLRVLLLHVAQHNRVR